MAKGKGRKVRISRVRPQQMCPACVDRDAVNLIGRPRFVRGSRLTGGCELCGGRGEVTLGYTFGGAAYDPWVISKVAAA